MSIEWILYLIYLFCNLGNLLGIISAFCFLFIVIISIVMHIEYCDYNEDSEEGKKYQSYVKTIPKKIGIVIFLITLSCFIPNEKTMYLMLGANYLKNSKLPSKVELVIEKKIDSYLSEDKKMTEANS